MFKNAFLKVGESMFLNREINIWPSLEEAMFTNDPVAFYRNRKTFTSSSLVMSYVYLRWAKLKSFCLPYLNLNDKGNSKKQH